jgi:photosystem II stability/assembly factor-like uncharacterized protein
MLRPLLALGLSLSTLALGCHREPEMIPLVERTIYLTDRFYDVEALSPEKAIVVGYGGKVILTDNGGMSWTAVESGTDEALYGIELVDDKTGWVVGQDGLVMRTEDGGKTWAKQESNATFQEREGPVRPAYLFNVAAIDGDRAWAVGDRSILASTTDGGKTWRSRKVEVAQDDITGGQSLAAADPIFYDVKFADAQRGWIVGEFGKILATTDGGETWQEQTKTLLEGTEFFDVLDLPTLYGLFVRSDQVAMASGLEAHIASTANGGQRWQYDEIDGGKVPLIDPLFDIVELPNGTGWSVGAAGEVVKRDPGAPAWQRASIGQDVLTWIRSVEFFDDKNGWMVGGFGLIFRTTDGGKSWLPAQGG